MQAGGQPVSLDGEASCEAVCLVGWLVVKLSPWMVDWSCGCLGGRAVSLNSEAGREAVSLVGWLAVGLSAWVIVGWWADGRAVSVDGERLSAWLVGWWSSCHLGWLVGVVAVWVLSCELGW